MKWPWHHPTIPVTLIENDIKIVKEEVVAEIFNQFFVNKIQKLEGNIDPSYVEDPLTRLKAKLEGKKLHFSLNGRETRGVSDGKLIEPPTLNTFIGNATRLWNKAQSAIKTSKSISTVKKDINLSCIGY